MKSRFFSWLLFGLMFIIVVGMGLYARNASTQASIRVEWSTASELDTVGFNIYRSQSGSDPGVQVNSDLIPASEDAQTGSDYAYNDKKVIPGKTYYYYLEDVSADGSSSRHGPVVVKAESKGTLEWILTGILALFAFISWITLVLPQSRKGS